MNKGNFSNLIWRDIDVLQAELSLALMDNAIQGASPYELAKRLQPLVKQSIVSAQAKSERLARTETARVQTQAEMDSLRRYGYKYCKWHAEIGHCSHCGALAEVDNGYGSGIYKVDEVPSIPGDTHPNCRCAISAYWVEELALTKCIEHGIPRYFEPNSVIGKTKEGSITSFRIYGNKGHASVDLDLTNHGNPKRHPIVPHAHNWTRNKYNDMIERDRNGRKLTQHEQERVKRWLKDAKH